MTLLKKKVKQVSLDFKKLSADVVSRIEVLDKEASLQNENDCEDNDCQIICEDDKPVPERQNQKIDRFFSSVDSKPKEYQSCGITLDKCDAKITLSSDSDSESDENDVQDLSSSEESEKDEDAENPESTESGTKKQTEETKDGEKASNEPSNEKSEKEAKKRRSSAMVQAEKKRKELDKARRRIEREAAKLKRMEELAKVKEEKRKEKEKAAAEREALKQQQEKEKEEKRIKREEAKRERDRAKEEERLKKEDEKQKKEEERKKREEEKQEKLGKLEQAKKEKEEAKKQEAEAKKQEAEVLQRKVEKQALLFNSFFIKDQPKPAAEKSENKEVVKSCNDGRFGNFHVKKGMRLAPRRQSIVLSAKVAESLDDFLSSKKSNSLQNLYLRELQSGRRKAMTLKATWPLEKMDGEVQCLGTSFEASKADKEWYRAKLVQFCENTRPSYYGTFRRRSRVISGRNPFQKDLRLFDYEIDSDEEWEEDPGESLSHSENEDEDVAEEDVDEENDGFFVPHGYLSEDEEADDDEDRITPEMRKLKQQMSEARFEASMKKKIQALVNVLVPPSVDPKEHPLLSSFKIIELTDTFPIAISSVVQSSSATRAVTKNGVPDEAMPDIVRLIHGNKLRLKKLLFEFRMFWEHKLSDRIPAVTYEEDLKGRDWKEFSISKTQLEKRIREVAKFEDGTWRVGAETLAVYPAEDVNCWKYITNVLEITRKKRVSSPSKPIPQKSPEKEIDNPEPNKAQPKSKTSSVEVKNEATKTPKKRPKAKPREEESKAEATSPKTPAKSPTTPKAEGGTPDTKMSPKSAKKMAQKEAMQKLKAELLKETTKVFTVTSPSNVVKPESGGGDGKSDTTAVATPQGGKSRKTAAKKRPNISASAPQSQKKIRPSSEGATEDGKQKPKPPPKKARKSEQTSSDSPGSKPKSKPNQSKPATASKPKPNSRRKSANKQESKEGKEEVKKPAANKESKEGKEEVKKPAANKEIKEGKEEVKKPAANKESKGGKEEVKKPAANKESKEGKEEVKKPAANQSNDTKEPETSKEITNLAREPKESNSQPDSQPVSEKSTSNPSHKPFSVNLSDCTKDKIIAVNGNDSCKVDNSSTPEGNPRAKEHVVSYAVDKSQQSTKEEKPSTTAADTSAVSKPVKKFSINAMFNAGNGAKGANPGPLKENQQKVFCKDSTGKKADGKKKIGEGQKPAKKVLMNGRPMKRLSDTNALSKMPARKVRFYDKTSEDEVEIIDLIDS